MASRPPPSALRSAWPFRATLRATLGRTGDHTTPTTQGGAEAVTTVTGGEILQVVAEPFELLRALSARRSLDQVRALRWTGDGTGLVALLPRFYTGGYALPTADLVE